MKHISLRVNERFHNELKILALRNNKTMRNFILDFMQEEIYKSINERLEYEYKISEEK